MDLNYLYNEYSEIRETINYYIKQHSILWSEKSIVAINKELHSLIDKLTAKRNQIIQELIKGG